MNAIVRLVVVLALALSVLTGCSINPVTGEREFMLISEAGEMKMGDAAVPDVCAMYGGVYRDPALHAYLNDIVMRLHAVSHRSHLALDFTILNTSIVNAFAIPGHVYATRGFVARMENEAQFAFVMGHEIGHVSARHSAAKMSRGLFMNVLLAGGAVAAGESDARWAVELGGVGAALLGLSYSREAEYEADRLGAVYAAAVGWDAREGIAVQRILASLHKGEPGMLDRYLSTHPPSEERIINIEYVIDSEGLDRPYGAAGDGIDARRWNARRGSVINVHKAYKPYDEGTAALRKGDYAAALAGADSALALDRNQAPFHRLKADALVGLKRYDPARVSYHTALRLDPVYALALIGCGELNLATAYYADAEKQFTQAIKVWPSNGRAWRGQGLARYAQRLYRDAIDPLAKVAPVFPKDAEVQYALAICLDRTGDTAAALTSYENAIKAGVSGPERRHAEQRVRDLRR